MKACILERCAPVENYPLKFTDVDAPEPQSGQVLLKVSACGICRTDLHVCEGDLAVRCSPVIPGHQIVGTVEKLGTNVTNLEIGLRVGYRMASPDVRHLPLLPQG